MNFVKFLRTSFLLQNTSEWIAFRYFIGSKYTFCMQYLRTGWLIPNGGKNIALFYFLI